MPLCEVIPTPDDPTKGKIRWGFHPGQRRAWASEKRFVVVLSGTQGGKTSFGPAWLWREIQRRGPGDYLVVAPTHPLLIKKALPEFLRLFKRQLHAGEYASQQKVFTFNDHGETVAFGAVQPEPTQVFFGHASDPESLESATAKGCWLDEAGQTKFRVGSWEAIQRRLSIHEGRALITTTPYDMSWIHKLLWSPWEQSGRNHPYIDVVRFDSTENPAFPLREFERARATLPRWKFDLFYRAIFTRPAGLIYSSFDAAKHKIPRFTIPPTWPRHLGLDFGGANTAGLFLAEELSHENAKPTGRYIVYREYRSGERSAAEHCYHLMRGDERNAPEPRTPNAAGGSRSEGQWRREFAQGGTVNGVRVQGIPIHGPAKANANTSVEVGVNRVFAAFALDRLIVFDDLVHFLDEIESYSYAVDEMGEPTDKIADKETYHLLDALRYIIGRINPDKVEPVLKGSLIARPGLSNL